MIQYARFPINEQGLVPMVSAANAVAPFIYLNGLKIDAQARVVVVP